MEDCEGAAAATEREVRGEAGLLLDRFPEPKQDFCAAVCVPEPADLRQADDVQFRGQDCDVLRQKQLPARTPLRLLTYCLRDAAYSYSYSYSYSDSYAYSSNFN